MSSVIRKMKRKNKKSYALKVSFCSMHGSYTRDDLCPCYDAGGSHENVDYETNFRDVMRNGIAKDSLEQICACPIHGIYSPDDLCECYGTNGELKEDWDKDLK